MNGPKGAPAASQGPFPELWLIAGPNGAGKTTLTSSQDIRDVIGLGDDILVLNPDRLAAEAREAYPELLRHFIESCCPGFFTTWVNWMAVRRVEKLITVSLEARKSVLVETVLSTGKYLRHVERARQLGYHVSMIFVALPTPALHVRRVKSRHASGGHDVPQEKIRSRWYRSHDFLALFALIVDHLFVFSNADPSGKPILVARKRQFTESVEIVSPEALPRVTEVLSAAASADEDGG